jgi:hypothetical protein
MTYIQKLIKQHFPNKIITHRLSDLIYHVSNQNLDNSYIYLSIEKDNNSREFCYLMIDELVTLYQECPMLERSLYEIIISTNEVKVYIDFEYYTITNLDIKSSHIGPNCILKIFYHLLNFHRNTDLNTTNYIELAIQQFLVLES